MQTIRSPADLNELRRHLGTLRERLPMFVVTDHPSDFPDVYAARLHLSLPAPVVVDYAILDGNLSRLRRTLTDLGLTKLARHPSDDPIILETWL